MQLKQWANQNSKQRHVTSAKHTLGAKSGKARENVHPVLSARKRANGAMEPVPSAGKLASMFKHGKTFNRFCVREVGKPKIKQPNSMFVQLQSSAYAGEPNVLTTTKPIY